MLIGLLLAAVGLAIPGSAGAKRGVAARHHSAHHACKRKHHCAHARLLRFGPVSNTGSTANPTSAPAPTTPTTPGNEIAGTVASFTGGVLTINLTGGGSVSGKVTEGTELKCETPGDDDQGGTGDDEPSGPSSDAPMRADGIGGGEQGQSGDDTSGDDQGGGDDQGESSCPPEALKEGAMVREAELEVGPGGAVWEQIVLAA
jgi:hypothetical protein